MPIRKDTLILNDVQPLVMENPDSYILSSGYVGKDLKSVDVSKVYNLTFNSAVTAPATIQAATVATPMYLTGSNGIANYGANSNVPQLFQEQYVTTHGKYNPWYKSKSGITKDKYYAFIMSGTILEKVEGGAITTVRVGSPFIGGSNSYNESYSYVYHETDTHFYVVECYLSSSINGPYYSSTQSEGFYRIDKTSWAAANMVTLPAMSSTSVPVINDDNYAVFIPSLRGNTSATTNGVVAILHDKQLNAFTNVSYIPRISDNPGNSKDYINPTKASLVAGDSTNYKYYGLRYTHATGLYTLIRTLVPVGTKTVAVLADTANFADCTIENVPNSIQLSKILQINTSLPVSNTARFMYYFKDDLDNEYVVMATHNLKPVFGTSQASTLNAPENAIVFKVDPLVSSKLKFVQSISLPAGTMGIVPNSTGKSFLAVTPYSFRLYSWVLDAGEFSASNLMQSRGQITKASIDAYNQLWIATGSTVEIYHPSVSKYIKVIRQDSTPLIYIDQPITTNLLVSSYDLAGVRIQQEVTLQGINCKFSNGQSTITVTTNATSDIVTPITIQSPGAVNVVVTEY